MRYVLLVLRILLFFISSMGYWSYIRKKSNINIYFLPILTVGIQTTVLFLAGLLNILFEVSVLIFIAGILLFVFFYIREKKYKGDVKLGYVWFFSLFFIIGFILRGHLFLAYDNFSHWGLVVKEMIITNQYPNFTSEVIGFKAYPLGSSTYIYYFSKIVDTSESAQMLAQVFMMLTCILPLFIFIKKYSLFLTLCITVLTNFFFVYIIEINSLLVDTLLPLFGTATLCYLYFECGKNVKNITVKLLLSIPLLITTVLIKNSGIYFIIFAIFLILIQIFRKKRIESLIVILSPFIGILFWKKHCEYVFSNSVFSKHAMTLANYKKEFLQKDIVIIKKILRYMGRFSYTGTDLYFVLLLVIFVLVLAWYFDRENLKKHFNFIAVLFFIYVLYMLGMLGMYLFSMPIGEALVLASATRYRRTILIVLIYLLAMYIFKIVEKIKNLKIGYSICVLFVVIFLGMTRSVCDSKHFLRLPKTTENRVWLEKQIINYSVKPQKNYLICVSKNTSMDTKEYIYYVSKYLLNTWRISFSEMSSKNDIDNIQQFDYIFLMESNNELLNNWIKKNFPNQIGKKVIKIKE